MRIPNRLFMNAVRLIQSGRISRDYYVELDGDQTHIRKLNPHDEKLTYIQMLMKRHQNIERFAAKNNA